MLSSARKIGFSKQYSHHQINVISRVVVIGDDVGSQVPILSREQQVGPRTENDIRQPRLIPGESRVEVRGPRRKGTQILGIRIVLSEGSIEFQLGGRAELQLGPASNGIQWLDRARGIGDAIAEQHASANGP